MQRWRLSSTSCEVAEKGLGFDDVKGRTRAVHTHTSDSLAPLPPVSSTRAVLRGGAPGSRQVSSDGGSLWRAASISVSFETENCKVSTQTEEEPKQDTAIAVLRTLCKPNRQESRTPFHAFAVCSTRTNTICRQKHAWVTRPPTNWCVGRQIGFLAERHTFGQDQVKSRKCRF